jgi:hypothetical protein
MKLSDPPMGSGGWKLIEAEVRTIGRGIRAWHRSAWCTIAFGRRRYRL